MRIARIPFKFIEDRKELLRASPRANSLRVATISRKPFSSTQRSSPDSASCELLRDASSGFDARFERNAAGEASSVRPDAPM
jgi:hypothetical protein